MRYMKRLFPILLILLWVSCTQEQRDLRSALSVAGPNRGELEKVLDHYESEPEKLRAARYLISYMPYHSSYCGALDEFRAISDSLIPRMRSAELYNKYMSEIADSLRRKIKIRSDIWAISADYLISNIDEAFTLWKDGRWAKHLNFDEFCEYILPYKVEERQPLEEWRDIYRGLYCGDEETVDDAIDEYRAEPNIALQNIRDKAIGNVLAYSDSLETTDLFDLRVIKDIPYGDCVSLCDLGLLLYRSKGIPVAMDYVPGWADRAGAHSWMSVYTRRCKNIPVHAFSTGNPEDEIQCRRIAKVHRRTYKPNEELLRRTRKGYPIPPSLNDIFFKDVTSEYLKCDDVTVSVTNKVAGGNVYAAIFNNQQWVPIAYGKRKSFGKAYFEKLGRNALYLPVVIKRDGRQIPIGNPFYLHTNGEVEAVHGPDGEQTFDLTLSRKYPVYWLMAYAYNKTRGGYIQGSNTRDFCAAETVAAIPEDMEWAGHLPVTTLNAYRYFRFCPPAGKQCDLAELKFYNGDDQFIPRDIILPEVKYDMVVDGVPVRPSNIIDDDALTWFETDGSKELWIGVDMGEAAKVSGIYYSMRSDGNNFYPGYEYALKCWDGTEWQVLETFVATKEMKHTFKDVPQGSMLLVTCNTTGTQSRPFVERGGKIVWY